MGGGSRKHRLLQFRADVLGTKVTGSAVVEHTAMGSAWLGGRSVGYWSSIDEIREEWQIDRVFEPSMEEAQVAEAKEGWADAVKRTLSDYTKH